METFDIGSHVVIELEDNRKLAGYIVGVSEDGLTLKATHRESVMQRFVGDATKADIKRQLLEKPVWRLRLEMVRCGEILSATKSREAMMGMLQAGAERYLIASHEDGMQFRELAEPVLTFVNSGYIKIMEDTDDKINESEISVFEQTLDGTLDAILDEGDKAEAESEASGI